MKEKGITSDNIYVLLVDDQADLLQGLSRIITREFPGVSTVIATDGKEALAQLGKQDFALVMIDIRMPGMDGFSLLRKIRLTAPDTVVVMMTGYGSIEIAVKAIKEGAYDFITKPFDNPTLFKILRNGFEHGRLIRENSCLKDMLQAGGRFFDFVGCSKPMQQLYHAIKTAGKSDYTVLVRGASGTGKELVVKALHQCSNRAAKPLEMVNCPAIPEHLLESELFGHIRGAFTGADRDSKGVFAQANGGIVCLDEIGDVPMSIQAKLLRVIQEHEIKPVGSSSSRKVDVRIFSSTNRNLEQLIKEGKFREDLFYRLNVVTIQTPLLKEIKEDIPLLLAHFTAQVCRELDIDEKRFSLAAVELLSLQDWPGNVRELQNLVRKAILFCPDEVIGVDYVRGLVKKEVNISSLTEDSSYKNSKEKVIASFTLNYVNELLRQTKGNVSKAAEKSGLSRAALQKIMRKYDIRSEDFR